MNQSIKTPKTEEKKKKKLSTKKKRIDIITSVSAFILIITTLLLILNFCLPKHSFTFNGSDIVDRGGKIYKIVAENYRPVTYTKDDRFATLEVPFLSDKSPIYEVEGSNGALIYSPELDVMYKKADYNLPSLEDFAPNQLIISTTGTVEMSLALSYDSALISKYIELISNEENRVTDDLVTEMFVADETYYLSFRSERYPSIMYTVSFYEKNESSFYIYDKLTRYYYECDSDLYELLKGSDTESEDTSAEGTDIPGVEL